ncbi:ATP-binding protein [Actinosynnema sp. NPDC050436]|uniref:ATP-binding protein n=1 Tax=Actinosynnema sp. NPDC050436 TaxID=3155659 RepID=UPI0033E9C33F
MDDHHPASEVQKWVLADGDNQLAEVRRWVQRLLDDEVDGDTLGDVLLVVTELVSNAYDHGRHALEVRLVPPLRHRRLVRVEVDDSSSELPVLGRSRIADTRGMGLVMVNALCSSWGTSPLLVGKSVWADIVVPEQPGRPEG